MRGCIINCGERNGTKIDSPRTETQTERQLHDSRIRGIRAGKSIGEIATIMKWVVL